MGKDFKGGFWEESLGVRKLIQHHFDLNGGWVVVSQIYQVIHKKRVTTVNFQRNLDWILMCNVIVKAQKIPLPKGVRQLSTTNMTLRESVKVQKVPLLRRGWWLLILSMSIRVLFLLLLTRTGWKLTARSVSKFEMDVDREQELQSPNVPCADIPGAGMAMKGEEYIYVVPQVGVEFESEDHPCNCYSRYAEK